MVSLDEKRGEKVNDDHDESSNSNFVCRQSDDIVETLASALREADAPTMLTDTK